MIGPPQLIFPFKAGVINRTESIFCNKFLRGLNDMPIIYLDLMCLSKRKCEQKGPKKVSTFSTRFHVVSNVFPKYQMLTF